MWVFMIELSERLSAVAELARGACKLLDVGTDHGYIPVWLAQKGGFDRIAASDVNKAPLKRAMLSAAEYGVEDQIEFFLSDGLQSVDTDFDTVVIAGMGGETMANILAAAPWVKRAARLVLQPQSKLEELTGWLQDNGFALWDARLVRDAGKLYMVFSVYWTGEGLVDLLTLLADTRDPLLPDYLNETREKLTRAIAGMERGTAVDEDRLAGMCGQLALICEKTEEVKAW